MVSVADSLSRLDIDRRRLAKKTGLSLSRVEEIFGGAPPTAVELRTIAEYLRIPADALVRTGGSFGNSDLRYRKTPRRNPPLAAETRIREIESLLDRRNLLPPTNETWRVSASLDDRPSVERAATLIRNKICDKGRRLDPLPDLVERIDAAGLAHSVVLHELGVEGASTTLSGRGLIVIAERTFKPRMLFTCAHELAHVVLGHTEPGKWLIDEDTIEAFDSSDEQERLCNSLASALLQPAEGVARLLNSARRHFEIPDDSLTSTEVLLVARYFGTSFFAAAMRLEQLEIAPIGTTSSFERAIKADHKSFETYANDLGLPKRTPIDIPLLSPRLRRSIAHGVENGDVSLGRVSDIFGYSTIEMSHALT